jgi:hypothetical protein
MSIVKQFLDTVSTCLKIGWNQAPALAFAAVGIFALFAWLISPPPRLKDLSEAHGQLVAYQIEKDQSRPFAAHPSTYVLFSITGYTGRFWSQAITPSNAARIFPRPGVDVSFFYSPTHPFEVANRDGRKVYGLSVGGVALQSLERGLSTDWAFVLYVMPCLGVAMLLLSRWIWKREARDVLLE